MFEIEGRNIGVGCKPYIIAEVGINAWSDVRLAKRFIEVASEAGADAVKFQTHLADAEMVESEMRSMGAGDVYDTVVQCEWSVEDHYELQAHATAHDITFLSTPFSVEAVDVLVEVGVPAIKIGSGEMNNRCLVERAADTGKPLLVSTGMNTLSDIKETCAFLDDVADKYALLYCVSAYPARPEDFDFGTIGQLQEIAGDPVGFSDHSVGVEAAKVAIGNGASIIEKHFTIDRRLPGPDQEVSIEPDELSDLSGYADLVYETSGVREGVQEEEEEVRKWAQHSIVAREDIEKGEVINKGSITTKRPGSGVSAERYSEVVGSTARVDIFEGDIFEDKFFD
jgi:N-acetylneuraminate synthase/N,N'-diacetyllegionaminate synthase